MIAYLCAIGIVALIYCLLALPFSNSPRQGIEFPGPPFVFRGHKWRASNP